MLNAREKNAIISMVGALATKAGITVPTVEFFPAGKVAGRAYYKDHKVTFNEALANENFNAFTITLIHEVAHLAAHIKHGRGNIRPHGIEWQNMMRFFGIVDPKRCHSYDTANAKTRKYFHFEYTCDCKTTRELTSIRHNRILKGTKYHCRKCKGDLVYVRDLGQK